MQKKSEEILIHHELSKNIAKELGITHQTVLMSKKYINNSKIAKNVRMLCKIALLKEAERIKIQPIEDRRLEKELKRYFESIQL
ncbi:hypothetical protein UJ101_01371 [Flavobacteriaceae bacterium UJ101]|nr:hypothetical protein UJ101_01371 [Flavobacteriaceae bacterium UJ101]